MNYVGVHVRMWMCVGACTHHMQAFAQLVMWIICLALREGQCCHMLLITTQSLRQQKQQPSEPVGERQRGRL